MNQMLNSELRTILPESHFWSDAVLVMKVSSYEIVSHLVDCYEYLNSIEVVEAKIKTLI